MAGWTLEAAAVDGVFTDYGNPTDLEFVERINGLGHWSAYIPGLGGLAEPVSGQVVRLWWDKGGGDETLHYEGVVADVRRQTAIDAVLLRGFDLLGLLWQATAGGVRDYRAKTPHAIIQAAATPNPLLTNAQGTTVIPYGTAAAVPNKVDATIPGVALTLRADSHRLLTNIQRLALQAQYTNTDNPVALRRGLEFFAQLEGANASSPRFYMVRRRERAAVYTPETFNIPIDYVTARRGVEGMTAADAIRIIGTGVGLERVESTLHGAGARESVISDKTILGIANAAGNTNQDVMADRLLELLDPATEIVTAASLRYVTPTRLGDLVNVTETGEVTAQLRCFERAFSLSQRTLFYVLGRPRPYNESSLAHLAGVAEGTAQAPQMIGGGLAGSATAGPTSVNNDADFTATASFSTRAFKPLFDQGVVLRFVVDADVTPGTLVDVDLRVGDGSIFFVVMSQRTRAGQLGTIEGLVYVPSATFLAIGNSNDQTEAKLRIFNRSGGAHTFTLTLRGDIQG